MSAPPRWAPPAPSRSAPGAPGASGVRAGRTVGWDVLRIGFVLLVVLYHSTFIGPLVYTQFIPRKLVFPHQVGASLLLALSAYFIAATVRRGGGAGRTVRWWWGKLARLLPAFVVATVVAWGTLRYLAPGGLYYPTKHDLLYNLAMLWHANGDLLHIDYVDGSYWTIPLQLMAFTLAALLWRTRVGSGPALRVLMWAALLVPLAQWPFKEALGPYWSTSVDVLGLHRWHLFVAGIAIWMVSTGRLRRWHAALLLVTCVAAHAVHTGWVDAAGFGTDRAAVLGIALGLAAMTAVACGPDRFAALPPRVVRLITWGAGISYGVFLTHQTLGYVLMLRLQMLGVGPSLQTAAMLVNAVLCGWILTRLVERPSHRTLMRLWDAGPGRYGRARPDEAPAQPAAARTPGSTARSTRS